MALITIDPPKSTVNFGNGECVEKVDMSTVDPAIQLILFNEESKVGFVQYFSDSAEHPTRPPEGITNLKPWQSQLNDANKILFCKQNPKTFYSTVTPVGSPIVVTAKGWPQPDNSTEVAPSAQPSPNTSLYWDGTGFVWSVFPINLNLADSQNYVIRLVNDKAYTLLQPSDWYVVRQSETGKAIPEEWYEWRSSVRDAAKAKRTMISEKEDLSSLEAYCESSDFQTWPTEPN